jgi:hypothetical protein
VFEFEMVSELGRIESLERTDKTRAFLRLIHHQVGVDVVAVVNDVETVDVEADDVDIVADDFKALERFAHNQMLNSKLYK